MARTTEVIGQKDPPATGSLSQSVRTSELWAPDPVTVLAAFGAGAPIAVRGVVSMNKLW